jgi:ABC-2 type transport system permease protein
MTTTTLGLPAAEVAATQRVPMARLVKVELRKMIDTRAGLWLAIAMGLLTAAAVVLTLIFAPSEELTFGGLVAMTLTPQAFLLPVLGILLVTSEWGQRTALVTFTLEPSRTRVVLAKLAGALLLGLAVVAVGIAVAAVGNVVGTTVRDGTGAWSFGTQGMAYVILLQISAILQGLGFGLLVRNSAAAVVLYFVLPTAFSIVFTVVESLREVAPWIDLGTAQAPLLDFNHALTGEQWAQVGVTALTWIALPMAIGYVRLLRTEFASA